MVRSDFPWPDGTELPKVLPVAREVLLTELEGYFELRYTAPTQYYPGGLLFFRAPGVDLGASGLPSLLLYPPPYHPIEVLMVNRGWGGMTDSRRDVYEQTRTLAPINEFRVLKTPGEGIRSAAVFLGVSLYTINSWYHAFTPFADRSPTNYALKLWRELGYTDYDLEHTQAFQTPRWKQPRLDTSDDEDLVGEYGC